MRTATATLILIAWAVSQTPERSRLSTTVLAQTQKPRTSRFEVASVRRNTSQIARSANGMPGGGFTAINMSLRDLLSAAYSLPKDRILGGPDWVDSERYDVVAKGDGTNDVPRSLQSLLSERFALVVRRERRDYPAYFLVRATPDGKLGPNLKPARINCADPETRAAALASVELAKGPGCGATSGPRPHSRRRSGIEQHRWLLGCRAYVLDRTGLTGAFDVVLEWAPTPDAADGVSIFTAVREQLGLRLENGRTTLDVIVIERAERPQPQ